MSHMELCSFCLFGQADFRAETGDLFQQQDPDQGLGWFEEQVASMAFPQWLRLFPEVETGGLSPESLNPVRGLVPESLNPVRGLVPENRVHWE